MRIGIILSSCVAILLMSRPVFAQEKSAPKSATVGDVYRRLLQERLKNIERLRQYHQQGVFPRNHDFPAMTPYFVDVHGTHCAMAELVKESGATEIVRKVAELNNNIYVNDVKDGPFLEWMLSSGLTQEECARIQPRYPPRPKPPIEPMPPVIPIKPTPDPDDQRVKEHLASVEAELIANTFRSLQSAMAVLRARGRQEILGKSYAVVAPPADKNERATIVLKNQARSRQIEVMLTFFDGKGELVKQVIPRFHETSSYHVAMMAVGEELRVTYNSENTWVVVEWTAGPGLNITVPFATVADVKPSTSAGK